MSKENKTYPHSRYSDEWERCAGEVARSFCPEIHECSDCGAPVVKGYCCTYCGSNNP